MKTEPKVTKDDVLSWCPKPRGDQQPGNHAEIPPMRLEDAASSPGKVAENRALGDKLVQAFQQNKQGYDRFVLQWRMFPKLDPAGPPASCGCGCSCGCG
jgi:hypothetical protein